MKTKEPSTLTKILALLSARERRTGTVVLALMLVMALLETAGVASVMPFLAVLGNPGLVETNALLSRAYSLGGFESTDRFLFALGLGAFGLVVFTSLFRVFTTYAINRWSQMRRYSIGARLLEVYLRQPYEFFLGRNSADLTKSILSEVDEFVLNVLRPGMNVLAYGLVAAAIVALLVWTNPALAVVIILVLAGCYGGIYAVVRGVLRSRGASRVSVNRARFTAASEALGGIKDIKLLGCESAFLRRFEGPASQLSRHIVVSQTVQTAPRYLIEAVGFGGVLAMALYLMTTGADLGTLLPVLGLYTFAGYRLLPAAQQIYGGLSALRFGLAAAEELYVDLGARSATAHRLAPAPEPLGLKSEVRFDGVSFCYPNAEAATLRSVDLRIPARTSIAFVGRTGAGKTTAVDLLLGLLRPTEGHIRIDGVPLTDANLRQWQRTVGYVPQTIYLADASVRENIAFGLDASTIDDEAVRSAARVANIHDFIMSLPSGYDTLVGERGVRLSGGQRQRIGIARALYHDPAVLVLDEATSALDSATERAIMASVGQLSGKKTVVMIAHRMTTVEGCDSIVLLDDGRVTGVGSFDQLRRDNPSFRALATTAVGQTQGTGPRWDQPQREASVDEGERP